jgi:formyltetrahydrofolate deformylase
MDLVVTLQCRDQPGIVHAMTSAILACSGNIIENQQFTDPSTNTFVMRTRFETSLDFTMAQNTLKKGLAQFDPELRIRENEQKKKVLVLVSNTSHCLRDLFYLQELGELPIDIPAVISNQPTMRELVESHGVEYIHIPFDDIGVKAAESQLVELIEKYEIDLLVLARYMRILSPQLCANLEGKVINIHHSFLPGFKGANPYHQAHKRGVKIIGATAHFVTEDLDEGPIIAQDVSHVTHAASPEELISLGRDIERRVLSSAVRLFAQDRIFIVGNRTVVFN